MVLSGVGGRWPVGVVVGGVVPWVLSGRGVGGLQGQAGRLREFVGGSPELDVVDVGFSLAGRAVLEDRAVVLGCGREELLGGLRVLEEGGSAAGVLRGVGGGGVAGGGVGGVVFLFPGQGSQWVGMGRGVV